MKIVTVVGARPQFIKASSLSREMSKDDTFIEVIIHTGQHHDKNMSSIFFTEMQLPRPKYNLDISGLPHGAMTGRMIEGIENILIKEKPDAVLVYGDTNSTLAGALASSKLNIPLIHVEAGLRSGNLSMPEEINRIITDRISNLLICPTEQAMRNLRQEGFDSFKEATYHLAGDLMEDAAMFYRNIVRDGLHSSEFEQPYILFTCHRAENTNDLNNLSSIIEGINSISADVKIVWPVHPRVKRILKELDIPDSFILIEPVGYLKMINLIMGSKIVITDSGGLQKEAYFFNKFCVTIREETEWTELVDEGYNKLVGTNPKLIHQAVDDFLKKEFVKHSILYGGGKSAAKILDLLKDKIGS